MCCNNCEFFDEYGYCRMDDRRTKEQTKIPNPNAECESGMFEARNVKKQMRETYDIIYNTIDYYMDMPEEQKNLVTLWIIGTHFHENFETFPYLFVNAMRGSGKTRLLKIISMFAKEGQHVTSVTEAIIFRTRGALIIDEFEGVGGKDKNSLRELLNTAYKRGSKVFRMKKQKGLDGENQVVEEFQPYRPIVMANIWGMEEVLGDRCINITLEKSENSLKTKLVEDFGGDFKNCNYTNYTRKSALTTLNSLVRCSLCSLCMKKNIAQKWNNYITTLNNTTTLSTSDYTNYTKFSDNLDTEEMIEEDSDFNIKTDFLPLFEKIYGTNIDGRNLELFFPLFLIASESGEDVLLKTIEYSKSVIENKKTEEITESKDVLVYHFVSGMDHSWYNIKTLANNFKFFISEGENEFINVRWFGKALKRLNLVAKKRRLGEGVQVILDIDKAKSKKAIFE